MSSIEHPQTVSRFPRPPLVKGLPVIGSLRDLLQNPHAFVKQAYRQHGEVFRFRALHREYVVLAGQDANRLVAGENRDLFCVDGFWGKAMQYMGCPHMLVGVDGEIHAHQRNLMLPLLSQNAFRDRIASLAEPVQSLLLKNAGREEITWGPLARQLVSHQIGYNLQGYKTSYRTVQQMIYYFGGVMNVFGLRKWPRGMLLTPRFLLAKAVTRRQVETTLARAEQRTPAERQSHPLYLDTILPALKSRPDWYSRGDMHSHAMLPFIAALDTVASTLGFMLYRLLREPSLQQRLQAEVDAAFRHGLPDIKTLRTLDDLNGMVKETLRLQPTAFGITRNATRDFVFRDHRIRKGDDILIFTTADHTNPDFFPDPDTFNIERYRAPRNEHRSPAYAPFGKGPHMCLGASLADIILPLNLGLILYHLEITPACDLNTVKTVFNPAPVLSDTFKIRLRLRHN